MQVIHRQYSVRKSEFQARCFAARKILALSAIVLSSAWATPSHGGCTSENIGHAGSLLDGAGGALLFTAQDVFVSGNFAYVASRYASALEIIDISNPATPVHAGVIQHGDGGAQLRDPAGVFVSDGYAYVTSSDYSTFEVVDVSDPTAPSHVAALTDGQGGASLGGAESVYVSDGFAYVTAFQDGVLEIIDVSNPLAPAHVASSPVDTPWSVVVDGDYAYVVSRHENKMVVIDVSNPHVPVLAGSIADDEGGAVFDSPSAVRVRGQYAYVAGENDFEIVDISDPTNPTHLGWTSTGGNRREAGLFIAGGYAFIAASETDSLEIVNIFDPAAPQKVASLTHGAAGAMLEGAFAVFVDGDYAFVAARNSDALEVVDVFDFAVDCPPELEIDEPDGFGDLADQSFDIEWTDSDDENASITFFYDTDRSGENGIRIPGVFDEDDTADQFTWDTSEVPDGSYYVYGRIDDGAQVVVDYSFGPVTVSHPDTPPTITILEPDGVDDLADLNYTITWNDDDPEDNASITLFYDDDNTGANGTQITTGLIDENDPADTFVWDTAMVPAGTYYIYGRIDDGAQVVVDYSSGPVTISHANSSPTITLLEPDGIGDVADAVYTITWEDEDPDDNAAVRLFYDDDASGENGTLITVSGPIDEDDGSDQFIWNTAGIPAGQYYLYAEIDDGTNAPVTNYSSASVTIEHLAPSDWQPARLLRTPRKNHTSTLLLSGKVLVTGGEFGGFLSGTEIYDPQDGSWTFSGAMGYAREEHTATILPTGEVLIVGGWGGAGSWPETGRSAELFDPDTGIWKSAGFLTNPRQGHTATLLHSGKILVAGGLGDDPSTVELYDPETGDWETTGSLSSARYQHTATLLPDGQVLVAGGRGGGLHFASAEIYDPQTRTWTGTGSLGSPRARHTATLLPTGQVLAAGGNLGNARLAGAELFDPVTGSWTPTGSLNYSRIAHTATQLPSGDVLVTGGRYEPSSFNGEVYDHLAGTWGRTSLLGSERYLHTATLLPSGDVLVAGGLEDTTPTTELYRPEPGVWSDTGFLSAPRREHTATLLTSGEVLVAGGHQSGFGRLSSVELYNADSGAWMTTRSLDEARSEHAAAALRSGKILVVGGIGDGEVLRSAEVYDPIDRIWSDAGSLQTPRYQHTATLLPSSGKILVTGGDDGVPSYLSSCELYDPARISWDPTGGMNTGRQRHAATLLPSGKVLVVGGFDSGSSLASAEIYDPDDGTWEPTAFLTHLRAWPTATLLPSGNVLVTGGFDGDNALASAEIYDPDAETWADTGSLLTARFRHTATLLPSGHVLVTGGGEEAEVFDPGTGTWKAAASPAIPRSGHTATLLSTGKVLVAGEDQAELYNPSPGTEVRRPIIQSIPTAISHGVPFSITGLLFRGDSEADGGTSASSATNYPLVRLHHVDSGDLDWLPFDPPSPASSFWEDPIELQFSELPPEYDPGRYLVTVFANGISSKARAVELTCSLAISEGPTDAEAVPLGTPATFSVVALGARAMQWQKFLGIGAPGANEEGYADIDGAVGSTYTTPPVTAADAGAQYRVVADSRCLDLQGQEVIQSSDAATLHVFDETPPVATVVSPNGGEYLPLSDPAISEPNREVVTWEMSDNVRVCQVRVSLLFSDDGGANYHPAPEGGGLPANSGSGGACAHPGELDTNVIYELPAEPPSGTAGSLYLIQVEVTDQAGNTTIAKSGNPFFIVQPGSDFKTLIVSNLVRMREIWGSETDALATHLRDLANHPNVRGFLVDLNVNTSLATLYSQWDDDPANADLANRILFGCHDPFPADCDTDIDGIHDRLRSLLRIYDSVESIVLVGDDRIIPMTRIADRTTLISEQDYPRNGDLTPDGTTVGQALAANMYLSDDPLTVLDPIHTDELDSSIFIPDLAIGRLVETPPEIIGTIATYISQNGVLDLSELNADSGHKVQVSGYDFLQDCAKRIRQRWKTAFERLTAPESLAPVDGTLISQSWDDQDLLEHLCGNGDAPYGLLSLNGHAVHYAEGIPGSDPFDIRGLDAADLVDPAACGGGPLDLSGSVLYSIGCHSGLPVAGSDPADADHSLDLPQTFLSLGAVAYAANSGYGWGLKSGVGYSERLVELFTEAMSQGGTIGVGEAVKLAKQRYFLESPRFDPYDEKTLMQWTLFGLPMYAVNTGIPSGGEGESSLDDRPRRLEELPETESFDSLEVTRDLDVATAKIGLETPPPEYLLRLPQRFDLNAEGFYTKYDAGGEVIDNPADGCPNPDGCYYTFNGLATGKTDLPIQPFFIYDSRISATSQHGILWMGGEYDEEVDWVPIVAELMSNGGDASEFGATPRLYHSVPTGLHLVPGENPAVCRSSDRELNSMVVTLGEVLKHQLSDPVYNIQRLYRAVDVELLYYNNTVDSTLNCDREGPLMEPGPLGGQYHQVVATTVEWAVPILPEEEAWRVIVAYNDHTLDSEGRGRWLPIELADEGGTWRGSIDAAGASRLTYMVQAVDRRGNVSWLKFTAAELPASGVPLGLPDPIDVDISLGTADLAIAVNDAPDPVQAGNPLIYTVTVQNLGPDPASQVTVTDSLPEGASLVSASDETWECTGNATTVTCDLGFLDAGASAPPLNVVLAAPSARGTLANAVSVEALQIDPDPANNGASETTEVIDLADLSLTKDDGRTIAVPGEAISYLITVANVGPGTVTDLSVTDDLPAAILEPVFTPSSGNYDSDTGTWTGLELGPGQNVTLTLDGTVDPQASGTLVNTASVTPRSGVIDLYPDNNADADTDVLETPPSIEVTLTADPPTVEEPGESVTYTVVVANNSSPTDPLTLLFLFDDVGDLDGVGDCLIPPPLDAGNIYTCSYNREVAGDAGDTVTTNVTVEAEDDEGDATTASDSATVSVVGTDYGDAPDPGYPTLMASDGARHTIRPGFYLGNGVDADSDGQPAVDAEGDDLARGDDEDGVLLTLPLVADDRVTITVVASMAGVLDAWIDFNGDGDWSDAGERILDGLALISGSNDVPFDVSTDATDDVVSFARFRLSSTGITGPTGPASDGEVEDYRVEIIAPPVVERFHSVASTGGGGLDPGEQTIAAITQLSVTFSEPVVGGDVAANYLLVATGADGDFQTDTCAGSLQGDDQAVAIDGVDYDTDTDTAHLWLHGGQPLPRGAYRIFACGGIEDLEGNSLPEIGHDFRILVDHLLLNPNFDQDLVGWLLNSPPPTSTVHSAQDFDQATTSGSALVIDLSGPEPAALSQCLAGNAGAILTFGGAARIASPSAQEPAVGALLEAFASPDCTGEPLAGASSVPLAGDGGDLWQVLPAGALQVPDAAGSVLISFVVQAGTAAGFDVGFDDLLLFEQQIFADSFESGDTSEWSATVP